MFKCCMCNGTSRKASEETNSQADDTPIGSPKLTEKVVSEISEKVDDDNQSLTNKLNGNVQREDNAEKTPSVASDSSSSPVRANSVIRNINSCEIPQNGNVDIEENLDPDLIDPTETDIEENLDGDSIEKAPEADSSIADDKDSVIFIGDKDSINFAGDKDSINFAGDKDSVNFAGDKDSINFVGDKDSINLVGDKDSVNFAGDKDSINFVGNKDSINLVGDKDSINLVGDKDSVHFAADKDSVNFADDKDSINFVGDKDSINFAADKDSVNFAGDKDSINFAGDKDSINFAADKDSVIFAGDKDTISLAGDEDSVNFAADKDSVIFTGDKDTISLAGDEDSVNFAADKDSVIFAGDKDTISLAGDEDSVNFAADKDSINFTGDKDSINFADDKDSINLSGLDKNEIDNVNSDAISVAKTNLSDTSGYIEKIIDGPEDEGDDSVFEACSSENETIKEPPAVPIPSWQLEEDDGEYASEGCSGMQEPPATPIARDELALRRHRFFSDLLQAAQISTEHRVRFDPLGPMVHTGCENNDKEEQLEELVNRLENVTKRLENISVHGAIQTQDIAVQTCAPFSKEPTPAASLSEEDFSTSSTLHFNQQTIPDQSANMSLAAYENLLSGSVREYVEISQKIGGDVAEHSKLVEKVFKMQFDFIKMAEKRQQPNAQAEFIKLLGPMSGEIAKIQKFREEKRSSTFFNHLSAVSESIPALGWVAMSPTPAPFVKEMNDAGQFYTNRVLKEWKEKDKTHVNWCKAWVQTLTDLQQYIRQHHTTGLVWGKSGGGAPTNLPPPPPPSPPMPIADIAPSALNDDRSALFAQINRGEDITKNLKKVTSDMQTHKNPALRSGPAPFKAPTAANTAVKTVSPANVPIDKPPVFTRDGKKWLVEYHKGQTLTVDNVEMNNVVYMFRCQDSTLTVKGKINSVVMDSCRKSSVVFDSLVSSIEFVNCQSVQMQVLGKVPTISIDKTDGCQMFLSPESLNVELITSKSSEMNVMIPKANGDYSEYPVPEQFKTTISNNGLHTIAVDSLG